jgi:hypothetical protein
LVVLHTPVLVFGVVLANKSPAGACGRTGATPEGLRYCSPEGLRY